MKFDNVEITDSKMIKNVIENMILCSLMVLLFGKFNDNKLDELLFKIDDDGEIKNGYKNN